MGEQQGNGAACPFLDPSSSPCPAPARQPRTYPAGTCFPSSRPDRPCSRPRRSCGARRSRHGACRAGCTRARSSARGSALAAGTPAGRCAQDAVNPASLHLGSPCPNGSPARSAALSLTRKGGREGWVVLSSITAHIWWEAQSAKSQQPQEKKAGDGNDIQDKDRNSHSVGPRGRRLAERVHEHQLAVGRWDEKNLNCTTRGQT